MRPNAGQKKPKRQKKDRRQTVAALNYWRRMSRGKIRHSPARIEHVYDKTKWECCPLALGVSMGDSFSTMTGIRNKPFTR